MTHKRSRPSSRANDPRDHTTCSCGKRGYVDKQQARRVRSQMRKSGHLDLKPGQRLDIYRCTTNLWHLGHDSRRARPDLNDPRLRWVA